MKLAQNTITPKIFKGFPKYYSHLHKISQKYLLIFKVPKIFLNLKIYSELGIFFQKFQISDNFPFRCATKQ